jgi:ketosteroid isomerase-like protein
MSNQAADILLFNVVNPLQYAGSSTVKIRAKEWFSLYRGPIGYEIRDLTIPTGDDVAFCQYLYRARVRGQTERESTCGSGQPCASGRAMAHGSSP